MKDKKKSGRLIIENASQRTLDQKAFDEMIAIATGDINATGINNTIISVDDRAISGNFEKRIKNEKRNRLILIIILGIIGAICLTVLIWFGISLEQKSNEGKIRINYSSSYLEGKNFEDVISWLKKQGFTNIKTEAQEDLIIGLLKKDGEVEEVRIDGYTVYASDSMFYPDEEIIVVYHTFPD